MSAVAEWREQRPDEKAALDAFVRQMESELAANMHKGERRGWLDDAPRELVSEVLYHTAKLSYALRQYEQGDGTPEKVLEFAADTANMAMMVVDAAGALVVPQPCSTCGAQPHEGCQAESVGLGMGEDCHS